MVILIVAEITIKQKPFLYYNTRQLEGRAGETNGQVSNKGLAPPGVHISVIQSLKLLLLILPLDPKAKSPELLEAKSANDSPVLLPNPNETVLLSTGKRKRAI